MPVPGVPKTWILGSKTAINESGVRLWRTPDTVLDDDYTLLRGKLILTVLQVLLRALPMRIV